ncbi:MULTISPECIES: hypothetical protein [Streptomyces]|uniref:Uncharacterized protein n=1 Tax=Streptomyces mutomycini TaxID=284036 RepID=A0ABW0BCD5_9ACTN|nr:MULTISPECIES: hypothetical protein [Streptomyces]
MEIYLMAARVSHFHATQSLGEFTGRLASAVTGDQLNGASVVIRIFSDQFGDLLRVGYLAVKDEFSLFVAVHNDVVPIVALGPQQILNRVRIISDCCGGACVADASAGPGERRGR